MLISFFPGLLAGAVHVLAGPDHLAATAPLAADGQEGGVAVGLKWGLGHGLGVALVGILALALRSQLPLEALSLWGERLVGVVLIGLGLATLRRVGWLPVRFSWGTLLDRPHRHPGRPYVSLWIGMLHGLAGSAHLLGVLPALALPTLTDGALYLGGFGLGTAAAMGIFTGGIAGGMARLGPVGRARITGSLGLMSIVVGTVWVGVAF